MNEKKHTLVQSFGFAWEGIRFTFKYNRNIRIHVIITTLVILASIFLHIDSFELGVVCMMIVLVIISEMINTVVEEVVNMITKDYRIEAKIAKDVAAGMVLLTSICATIVGLLVFLPRIFHFFF